MGGLFGGGGSSAPAQPQIQTSVYPGTVRPAADINSDAAAAGVASPIADGATYDANGNLQPVGLSGTDNQTNGVPNDMIMTAQVPRYEDGSIVPDKFLSPVMLKRKRDAQTTIAGKKFDYSGTSLGENK